MEPLQTDMEPSLNGIHLINLLFPPLLSENIGYAQISKSFLALAARDKLLEVQVYHAKNARANPIYYHSKKPTEIVLREMNETVDLLQLE